MNFKVLITIAALVLSTVMLGAEETWQGNATIAQRGELDRSQYYAASNSFPQNTRISVTNLDNGKSVIVTVRKRIDGSSNVFLLLSESAGTALGMKPTDIIRIKTQVVGISNDLTGNINEFTYNRDVDTNPAIGTPDTTTDTTKITQASPTPLPSPSPSPSPSIIPTPTPTVTTITSRDPEKDRFTTPTGMENADVTARTIPPKDGKESLGSVDLAEAKVVEKDRAEAIIIRRPYSETDTARMRTGEEDLPRVAEKERAQTDVYSSRDPEKDEAVALLIEPVSVTRREEAVVTAYNRPVIERESIEVVLKDAELIQREIPIIYEAHGIKRADEEIQLASHDLPQVTEGEKAVIDAYAKTDAEKERVALATHNLPDVKESDKAAIDAYVKSEQEKDRVALASHDLPDLQEKDRPQVDALAKTDYETDSVALAKHNLPDVGEREKPDVTQKVTVEGKDTKTDIALVPTDPNPPTKHTSDTTVDTTTRDTTTIVRDAGAEYLRNYYYLQIGVYKNREAAERILKSNPAYPMMIVTGKVNNATVYKVVVGPLKRDESGTVLYLFQARGYKDAFIRFIE